MMIEVMKEDTADDLLLLHSLYMMASLLSFPYIIPGPGISPPVIMCNGMEERMSPKIFTIDL